MATNLNSDDDTESSSSDDDEPVANAIPNEETEEVATASPMPMPKRRRQGPKWTRRKPRAAKPPQPKPARTPKGPVAVEEDSSLPDDSSVSSSWAKRTATLFEDAGTRTWFLSLSHEEQAQIQLPQRRRLRTDILNICSVKGQFLQQAPSVKTPKRKKTTIRVDTPVAPAPAPVPRAPHPKPAPAPAPAPAPMALPPMALPPMAPASVARAPSANASWRRPHPRPAPAPAPAPTPPPPPPPRCRPTPLSEPLFAHKLELPDVCLLRAAQTQQAAGVDVPKSLLMVGTEVAPTMQWQTASQPDQPRVVDQDVLRRMLFELKPAAYSSSMNTLDPDSRHASQPWPRRGSTEFSQRF